MKKARMEKCIWRQTPAIDIKLVDFIKEFSYISVSDLEDIFEYLEEQGFLNDKGKEFRDDFWRTFFKE